MTAELADRYTDGCARLLLLEAEDLRTKRRLKAATADSAHDRRAAAEAGELARRRDVLRHEADELRAGLRLQRAELECSSMRG